MVFPAQPDDLGASVDGSANANVVEAQARRIQQLEQALDQAMLYLEDLRQRTQHHEDLEAQLAIAQDYAYVQERAIASLKSQLESRLEPSPMQASPVQVNPTQASSTPSEPASAPDEDSSAYPASPVNRDVARWKQQATELQTQCASHQLRCTALEGEISDLQEQVLQQAKQASEYETAVHFWKTQCHLSQQMLDQLRCSLEQEAERLPEENAAAIRALLTAEALAESTAPEPAALLELPDFLIRRLYYRNRQLLRDSRLG